MPENEKKMLLLCSSGWNVLFKHRSLM